VGPELLAPGQLLPQGVVPAPDQLDDLLRVHGVVEQVAGLQVEELAVQVLVGDRQIVVALPLGQLRVQLTGLGVDEVRRELTGAAPEQHVRQRHVAPEEPGQVQPDQEHHQGIDQPGQAVRAQAVGEQ
jgi:hypothetical protein